MAILRCFSDGSMLGSPFTDYLNVTTPVDNADSLRSAVAEMFIRFFAKPEIVVFELRKN